MRRTYLVTYDIRDDKRLRKVHRTMKNFGDHLQYSVFECQFSTTDLKQCRAALAEIIHHREDQVLIIDLGKTDTRGERVIVSLGQAYQPFDQPCVIV